MELGVGIETLEHALGGAEGREGGPDLTAMLIIRRLERLAKGQRLQQQPQLIDPRGLVGGQLGDAGPPLWQQLNEPLTSEPLERFAQRRSANVPTFGQVTGVQPLTWPELTAQYGLSQTILSPFGSRSGRGGGHGRYGSPCQLDL